MLRKWIRKIVNEEMNTTMKEMFDAGVEEHYDDIMERATEKIADNAVIDTQEIVEHLDVDASDLANELDMYDIVYHLDTSEIASEFDVSDIADAVDISDVADRIDMDDLASYVANSVSENIDVDYKEVASNLSIDELVCEIDVTTLAEQIMDNDSMFTAAMQKALAIHDAKITKVFQELADTLYNVVAALDSEERREVEE